MRLSKSQARLKPSKNPYGSNIMKNFNLENATQESVQSITSNLFGLREFQAALPYFNNELSLYCFDKDIADICQQPLVSFDDDDVQRLVKENRVTMFFIVQDEQGLVLDMNVSREALAMVIVKRDFAAIGHFVVALQAVLRAQ